jgi:hypothetical protein
MNSTGATAKFQLRTVLTPYYIAIKAYTGSGKESAFSQEVSGVAK